MFTVRSSAYSPICVLSSSASSFHPRLLSVCVPAAHLLLYSTPWTVETTENMSGFMDEIRKIPPVTRFLCGSLLGVSIPMITQLVSAYKLVFVKDLVTRQYEVSK